MSEDREDTPVPETMQALRRKDLKELADKFQYLVPPLQSAVEHIKQANTHQQTANFEAQRTNRELHQSNNRQNLTIGLVVLITVSSFVQTVLNHYTNQAQDELQQKLEMQKDKTDQALTKLDENRRKGEELFTELKMLKDKVEEAPSITVDPKTGEPLWDVAITDAQAQELKRPRRRGSPVAKRIKVKKSAVKSKKSRAQVPMGF